MSSEWVRHSVDKFVDSHLLLLVPLQAYHLIIETRFQRCLQMQSNLDQGKHEALGSCVGSRTWSPHKHANCPCETRLEIILLRAKLLSKIRFYTLSITLMNRLLIKSIQESSSICPNQLDHLEHTHSLCSNAASATMSGACFPAHNGLAAFQHAPAMVEWPLLLLGHETKSCLKTKNMKAIDFFSLFPYLFRPSLTLSIATAICISSRHESARLPKLSQWLQHRGVQRQIVMTYSDN